MKRYRKSRGPTDSNRLTGDDLDAQVRAVTAFGVRTDPANVDVFAPRQEQMVPKPGAWAMITRSLPPMERDLHDHLRVGRVFYVQHESNADPEGFISEGRYRVDCDSPWGSVKLWPYEYSVIPAERLILLWQEHALTFHPTNVSQAQFDHVVFYIRSRGIALADAMVMALGTVVGNVGWFEPATPELASWMEDIEKEIHSSPTSALHQARRKAAREAAGRR